VSDAKFTALIVAFFVFMVGGLIGGNTWLMLWMGSKSCHAKWGMAGYETHYDPWTGCMVRVGGKWIPVETIRDVEVTK